jgi:Spy/CpxP family protein refolding chaperone
MSMHSIARLAAFAVLTTLAGAGTLAAQGGPPGGMRGRGPGGPGGGPAMMDRALLRGITLTDAQKASLDKIRDADRAAMEANADQNRAEMDAIREARQSGDTAKARELMAAQRAKMDARRDQQIAAIRAILTGDQLTTFDANVAEMKKREAEMGPGRGRRGGPPPLSPIE